MAFGHFCTKIHYNQNAADKGVMRFPFIGSKIMKIASRVFIVLSVLSIISGVGYLAIGLSSSNPNSSFSMLSGVLQIVVALFVLVSSLGYKNQGNKFKIPFLVSSALYVGFVVYVVS